MSFPLSDILKWSEGRLANEPALGDRRDGIRAERLAALSGSGPGDVAFFFSQDYKAELPAARPGVLVTAEPFVKPMEAAGLPFWGSTAVVACADPYLAMARLSEKFAERTSTAAHITRRGDGEPQVHPSAVVVPGSRLGKGSSIGPHCVVESDAEIGERTVLYPGVTVGAEAKIGNDCVLFPRVTVYESMVIGNRVRIHAGAVIGADGFGYAPVKDADGRVVRHQKIYHVGRVVIGDDVEIGANTCLDRGTFGDTVVAAGAKIDNQVQVGHNATVQEGAIICGCTALAGSSTVGKFAYIGGLVGITNKVVVGDRACVAAASLLSKDVPPDVTVAGNPQRTYRDHFRAHAALNKLAGGRGGKGK